LPTGKGHIDVLLLALRGASAKQNDQSVSVLAEIDAVSGTETNPAFKHSGTEPLTFEKLPWASRVRAMATLAAACAFRRSNQAA